MPQPLATLAPTAALLTLLLAIGPMPAGATPPQPPASASQPGAAPALQPVVRLPAITSRLRRHGAPEAPDITLDEIERCLGQDLAMQQEVHSARLRQQALSEERASLEQTSTALQGSLTELAQASEGLKAQSARWSDAHAGLQRQAEDIERKRVQRPQRQAEVDAFNALVKAHNSELERLREWRSRLLKDQAALEQRVVAHNARNTEANASVAAFNARHEAFQAETAALVARSGQTVAACGGTRTLRK